MINDKLFTAYDRVFGDATRDLSAKEVHMTQADLQAQSAGESTPVERQALAQAIHQALVDPALTKDEKTVFYERLEQVIKKDTKANQRLGLLPANLSEAERQILRDRALPGTPKRLHLVAA